MQSIICKSCAKFVMKISNSIKTFLLMKKSPNLMKMSTTNNQASTLSMNKKMAPRVNSMDILSQRIRGRLWRNSLITLKYNLSNRLSIQFRLMKRVWHSPITFIKTIMIQMNIVNYYKGINCLSSSKRVMRTYLLNSKGFKRERRIS